MGRQAYLNRLALGRSPYEAPENTNVELTGPSQQSSSVLHGDGYVQQYDERGHPVNTESKALGRGLRRAKNDILSTMGIVVSGKDENAGTSNEKQNVDMITTENAFGLVVAVVDPFLMLLGSWWTFSLVRRVQTFKHYAYAPLMEIINTERATFGPLGFYFSGIPAVVVSAGVTACRSIVESVVSAFREWLLYFSSNKALDWLIRSFCSLVHSGTEGALHIIDVQVHLYFLLQSLHLIHPYSLPGLRLLVPFGEPGLMQFPPLPADLSFRSISQFSFSLLTAPPVLFSLRGYFRRLFRKRLYKLIRRRLPKPTHVEETSIKVAIDNDLVDWIVPSLGRRSEEEVSRTGLTLAQDIINEIGYFKWWALSWIGIKPGPRIDPDRQARGALTQYEQGTESIHRLNEELRDQLGAAQAGVHLSQQRVTELRDLSGEQTPHHRGSAGPFALPQTPEPIFDSASARILSADERISQSPEELSMADLAEMPPLTRRRSVPSVEPVNREAHHRDNVHSNRRNSRTNTLFSRPSSPESSPPTSPRVRASLIHQNSDIITMQLELLSHRNQDRGNQPNPVDDSQNQIINRNEETPEPGSITEFTEFLETLAQNRDQNLPTLPNPDAVDSDTLSGVTARLSHLPGRTLTDAVSISQQNVLQDHPIPDSPVEPPTSSIANVLPDDMEEPPPLEPIGTQSEDGRNIDNLQPGPPDASTAAHNPPGDALPHRITILSSHPVDSLASNLAALITTVMFFPIESMYLRSLATSYLASQDASAALLSDVRRPFGFWAGGGSRSDVIPYARKLGLAVAIQGVAYAGVWGVLTGTVIRVGKIFCGWGSL